MKRSLPIDQRLKLSQPPRERWMPSQWLVMLLFCLLATSFTQEAVAQGRTITGRVISAQGEGLAGVTVVVRGTSTGTSTDVNGNFSLSLSGGQENGTLVFSYICFTS